METRPYNFALRTAALWDLNATRFQDNWLAFIKDLQEATALHTFNAFPGMDGIGMVHLAVAWTNNFDHGVMSKRDRRNHIPFWDINARLSIIQPP